MKKFLIIFLVIGFAQINTANAQIGNSIGKCLIPGGCGPQINLGEWRANLVFRHSSTGAIRHVTARGYDKYACIRDRRVKLEDIPRGHVNYFPYYIWWWQPISTPACSYYR